MWSDFDHMHHHHHRFWQIITSTSTAQYIKQSPLILEAAEDKEPEQIKPMITEWMLKHKSGLPFLFLQEFRYIIRQKVVNFLRAHYYLIYLWLSVHLHEAAHNTVSFSLRWHYNPVEKQQAEGIHHAQINVQIMLKESNLAETSVVLEYASNNVNINYLRTYRMIKHRQRWTCIVWIWMLCASSWKNEVIQLRERITSGLLPVSQSHVTARVTWLQGHRLLMMLLIYAVLIYTLYEHLYRVRNSVRFAKCNSIFLFK